MIVLGLLVLCSCANTTKLNDVSLASKAKDYNVEVFLDQRPDRPYIELGYLTDKNQYKIGATLSGRIESLKNLAKNMHADAVIITTFRSDSGSEHAEGGKVPPKKSSVVEAEGIAIAWKENVLTDKKEAEPSKK